MARRPGNLQPTSSRDFLRVAKQRLTTAEFLCDKDYNLDAMYLAGYTVECSLKALILHRTAANQVGFMLSKISSGGQMHKPEILGGILRNLGCTVPSIWSGGCAASGGLPICDMNSVAGAPEKLAAC
jgi:hypothetical protein